VSLYTDVGTVSKLIMSL